MSLLKICKCTIVYEFFLVSDCVYLILIPSLFSRRIGSIYKQYVIPVFNAVHFVIKTYVCVCLTDSMSTWYQFPLYQQVKDVTHV